MTNMALYREVIASETEHPGEPWVWQTEGRDGRHPTTSGDLEGEDGDGEKKNEVSQGAVAVSLGPRTEEQVLHIDSLNRDRRSTHRRLLVMCTVVVRAILRGRHMGSHDIKGAQWAKSKGTCRDVINFVAEHGLWATTSQIQHREDFHARFVEDKDLLSRDAECAAIPLDNCDFDPRVGVGQGEGSHLPFIAATALTVGPDVGRMDDWWKVKSRGSFTVEDVLMGPERDREDGARRYNEFSAELYRGVFAEARNNSDRAAADTCFESELRKVRYHLVTFSLLAFWFFHESRLTERMLPNYILRSSILSRALHPIPRPRRPSHPRANRRSNCDTRSPRRILPSVSAI